jgi:hypothetical protein
VNRAAALVTAAERYLAQGETLDDAIAHAVRRVPSSPAAQALARRLLAATLTRTTEARP